MATVLKKKPETNAELLDAIIRISADRNHRLMVADEIEWLTTKLKFCGKCARELKKRNAVKVRSAPTATRETKP